MRMKRDHEKNGAAAYAVQRGNTGAAVRSLHLFLLSPGTDRRLKLSKVDETLLFSGHDERLAAVHQNFRAGFGELGAEIGHGCDFVESG